MILLLFIEIPGWGGDDLTGKTKMQVQGVLLIRNPTYGVPQRGRNCIVHFRLDIGLTFDWEVIKFLACQIYSARNKKLVRSP